MNSIPLTGKILFGGDYYPEQWSEYQNIIDEDFDYMKKASVNTLTLGGGPGEYWKKKKDVFDFTLFDDIFEQALQNDIKIILSHHLRRFRYGWHRKIRK